jgi:glyoxylase-like metal-dependent hydrolase (beta-lactamase superfamily II)
MISIKTFVFNNLGVNTYILHDETLEAVIVDPACSNSGEFNRLFDYIHTNKLRPKAVINTHGHIDHIVGIIQTVGHFEIPFLIHSEDIYLLNAAKDMGIIFGFEVVEIPVPTKLINEGDKIEFGNSNLEVIHVPGHSPGSVVFYSKSDGFIIAGDVLFSGSIGRTDLPRGDYDTLITGIKNKLLTLPLSTVVYCGHGPTTTIKIEHDTNPFLV